MLHRSQVSLVSLCLEMTNSVVKSYWISVYSQTIPFPYELLNTQLLHSTLSQVVFWLAVFMVLSLLSNLHVPPKDECNFSVLSKG